MAGSFDGIHARLWRPAGSCARRHRGIHPVNRRDRHITAWLAGRPVTEEVSMKKALGAIALCGVLLASTGTAFAQPYAPDQHHGRGHDRSHHPAHRYHGMYDQGRHEGWYKKGGHLPPSYRGSRYVVTDWHHSHLRQPPRGYHWVRSDNGDFLLVAITTGVIASIIAASH
jgi:Ni/Co efflux regulator RcnB